MAEYIERDAVAMRILGLTIVDPMVAQYADAVLYQIQQATAADVVEVKHGEWEWRGGIPWCSNCGKMPPGYSYDGDVNTTPYCPNCGAKLWRKNEGVI